MLAERFSRFVHRYRFGLFGVWLLHTFVVHYFYLGLMTWDGFGYRGMPVVELLQHGAMGKDKYYDWSLAGHLPFVELAHIPFLYLFGMKGFIIGFPLVVFPLCAAAIYGCIRELTGDETAATFGTFAYVAMPMINQQPFTAYIDFSVSGLLAFFLWSMLRLRTTQNALAYLRLGFATVIFTMSRVQGVYVLMVVFPILTYLVFVERDRFRLRVPRPLGLVFSTTVVVIGAIPAIAVQVWKYISFGSPSYPVRFEMFGIHIGSGGVALNDYFRMAGAGGHDWASVLKAGFMGWIWHGGWPIGAFYASTYMAAGLLGAVALPLLPLIARRMTRAELWVLAGLVGVSLLSRDFAIPRYGYTIVVVLAIILGKALSALSGSRRGQPVFWLVAVILFLHLLRPELDCMQVKHHEISARMNVTGSSRYLRPHQAFSIDPFPDIHGKFEIIELTGNNFLLHIFGRQLTNEVIGTIPGGVIGPRCEKLAEILQRDPAALFIDDHDFTKSCERECAIPSKRGCRAYKITPAEPAPLVPGQPVPEPPIPEPKNLTPPIPPPPAPDK